MTSLRRSIAVSILFTAFGGPGFVLVYFPYWMTHYRVAPGEPIWQKAIAGALMAAGATALLASILRFIFDGRGTLMPAVPTERVVTTGLYRYVRNPMYVAVVTALWGETLLFATHGMAMYTLTVWLLMHLFIVFYEEPTLAGRHPEDYSRYKRHVPRWLPRTTPWCDPKDASFADPG